MRLLKLRTVLAATDLDPSSDAALDSAHRLASAAGAALHVVHVLAPDKRGASQPPTPERQHDLLGGALRRAQVSERDVKLHLLPGRPAETIRSLAERVSADVIVLGPHRADGRHASDRPLGGTAQAVVANTFAPTLVAPLPLRLPLAHMLAPVDLSETARGALLVAISWASALRISSGGKPETTLTALNVDTATDSEPDPDALTALENELGMLGPGAGDWAGIDVQATVARGTDVAEAIAGYAEKHEMDLVVLGTRGLGMNDEARLGSVSGRLTTRLKRPMLLVPPGVWRAYAAVP